MPPTATADDTLVDALAPHLQPLDPGDPDESLLDFMAQGRVVLLGEATHGTHEFYAMRARLTQRLIAEHGFTAVVVEADWPDAWRVNAHVRGLGNDTNANGALAGFSRFPTWMWRNTVVRDFVAWLREHNAGRPRRAHAGFYGMDMYSLYTSIQEVLAYLDRTDPPAARRARARYACFDQYGEDTQAYGYAASIGLKPHCEDEVVEQLRELNRRAASLGSRPGLERDEAFYAQQNARLVRNAEAYYRSMFHRKVPSWNLRDQHMIETLEALDRHMQADGEPRKLVVWAHNSHLGDASATAMGERGELNVGQLARERWGSDAMLVGFSTYNGTVAAASGWDAPVECIRVRDGLPGSFEALFHATGEPAFWLGLRSNAELLRLLDAPRPQRAIGVIYMPQTERQSHYFHTRLPAQFDAMVHIDSTRALEPLDAGSGWSGNEPPDTFPSGL